MGAWIEILHTSYYVSQISVAPLVGAWIEIQNYLSGRNYRTSLPSWERGLKYQHDCLHVSGCVAPLVGAWIEIEINLMYEMCTMVAPLVGAWIEIT